MNKKINSKDINHIFDLSYKVNMMIILESIQDLVVDIR